MQKMLLSFCQWTRNPSQHELWSVRAFGVALVWLVASAVSAATFTATLDRDTVTVGENATLTLKFEGGQPKSVPSLPNIPNLQIASQGTSQSYVMGTGGNSVTISYTYAVIPAQPGDYTIPTLGAIVDGKVLTSQPLKLKAIKASAAPNNAGDQLAFLKLVVPKKEV